MPNSINDYDVIGRDDTLIQVNGPNPAFFAGWILRQPVTSTPRR